MAKGKAVGEAVEGIVAKAAKRLMPKIADDVVEVGEKAALKGTAETGAKQTAKQTAEAGTKRTAGKSARASAGRGAHTGREPGVKTKTDDPIDVASGEVLLEQADVELPGVLPLVLRRAYGSSYDAGRWFGPHWASTLDQRLEVDVGGACFLGEDGTVLEFPVPLFDEAVAPIRGRHLLLSSDTEGYAVTDPEAGTTVRFAARPNADIPGERAMVLPVAAITDEAGNRIDVDYDRSGAPTELRHSGGYRIAVDRDEASGLVVGLRLLNASDDGDDVGGAATVLKRFGYDDAENLTEVATAAGAVTWFAYDDAGRMTSWTDSNGCWYAYIYDAGGRAVAGRGAGDHLNVELAYYDRATVVTDSSGQATTYHLNDLGQVTAVVDPLGRTTYTDWDVHDRALARTDALGRATRFTYDDAGDLVEVLRADGTRGTAVYEGHRPVETTDPDGTVWRQTYDEAGNLTSATDPTGAVTAYTYDGRGNLASVTDPAGGVTLVSCDAAGLPVEITDAVGSVTRYRRDRFGRITEIVDPMGGHTRFGWTVAGHLAWRSLPDGATEHWTYDGEDNLVDHTDALGQVTRFEVSDFDQRSATIAPDGARMEFGYDTELRLTTVTDPQGLVWRYVYDPAGNLVAETDFNGRQVGYGYDSTDRLVTRTNGAGQTVRFVRDVFGEVVEKHIEGQVTRFDHDPLGRLTSASGPGVDLRIDRDALGRVLAETCNGRTVSSTYDPAGRRIARRTPSGAEAAWAYDAAGRPIGLRTGGQALTFAYDPAGRETRRRIGAGAVLDHQWDSVGRLRTQTVWGAPTPADTGPVPQSGSVGPVAGPAGQARMLRHRGYAYRGDGNLVATADRTVGDRRYTLDPRGRVTAVAAEGWSERYAYDASGNLTHASRPTPDANPSGAPSAGQIGPGHEQGIGRTSGPVAGRTTGSTSAGDAEAIGDRELSGTLIRRAGNTRYEHDAQGRVVLRQQRRLSSKPWTWRYSYDADDRLVAVVTPEGWHWRYVYDPLGRRIAKHRLDEGGRIVERVDFTWDGPVPAERAHVVGGAVPGVTVWDYEPDTFRPLAQIERAPRDGSQEWYDRRFFAIVADLVGAPSELVDPAGEIAWHSRPTLWGTSGGASLAGVDCPLRFPGQYHDPETGLYYNYHRYYDPATAGYTTPDPIGLEGGYNPHTYVLNPGRLADPFGLTYSTSRSQVPWITSSLPASEESALRGTLAHIDAGTVPTGPTARRWGIPFRNRAGDLPGASGANSPYLEYRVAPPPGVRGAGPLRVVVNSATGERYYSWTHYGDSGSPAFVRIR